MLEPVKTVKLYQRPPSPKTFGPGEVIFTEGEQGEVMYGVISGEVEMWVNGKVVETIKEGDIFGEGALVHEDHKRASTAITKTDCQLAFLAREHFLFAVQQTPMFALDWTLDKKILVGEYTSLIKEGKQEGLSSASH